MGTFPRPGRLLEPVFEPAGGILTGGILPHRVGWTHLTQGPGETGPRGTSGCQLAKAKADVGGARAAIICASASDGTLSSTWRCPSPQAGQRVGSTPVRRSIRSCQVSGSDGSSLAAVVSRATPSR